MGSLRLLLLTHSNGKMPTATDTLLPRCPALHLVMVLHQTLNVILEDLLCQRWPPAARPLWQHSTGTVRTVLPILTDPECHALVNLATEIFPQCLEFLSTCTLATLLTFLEIKQGHPGMISQLELRQTAQELSENVCISLQEVWVAA
jgi:hypothetical protein